ncbi:biosynthetic-type acetolactate synthase large subunit [Alienimonas chondri]|uniref:Acetolactate synthase n=1 Tax=Alienimonas chondri TaxID=2681879 RepID=A0ABX1VD71_9PLAN|nr:biosynthetic-type acetolactate synthase large subunit [Alienimonas chondri]NNJ25460.1 Acetolactate synthase isozyme 2 large subunit [Alienimonas chondri]
MSTAAPAAPAAGAEVSDAKKTLNGAEVLVAGLVAQGVKNVFAYPGGASMPLHQALLAAQDELRTILPRHEQGGGFAAQGVSRVTGEVGVCMATSGPGATNLVTALADAKLDSVPMVAITGQVPQAVIGSDAFQETPMVEISRAITKHTYMLTDVRDVARVVKEAFFIARTGRPGPVLIDFPKDVQLATLPAEEVDHDPALDLPGYNPVVNDPKPAQIKQILAAIKRSKKPVIYVGGGCVTGGSSDALTSFALKTGIPVTTTVMGIGSFPGDHEQSLHMLGMHGTVPANYAVAEADLLLAFGVRFDDRVTGKLEEFARHGKIVHVDIDPAEIHKNKEAHIPVHADLGKTLEALNAAFDAADAPDIAAWREQIAEWKREHPLTYAETGPGGDTEAILQQHAIKTLYERTKALNPYVAVGVGQHQMWSAQFFKFAKPRHWLSSSGLGTMGFGLPAAMGVAAELPDELVIDIDGDGSFLMNVQELATLTCEKLPVKILLLNNQHLGMVVQWEDRFMSGRRAHTYLGPIDNPEWFGEGTGDTQGETYPNFVQIARGFGVEAAQVRKKSELPAALDKMIEAKGPYLLDVICPYQEHVLPMIPAGGTARDMITK